MRTAPTLVVIALVGLSACSTSAGPSQSASPDPTHAIEATPSPAVEPTPSQTVAPTPSPSEEPTPSPAVLTLDRVEGERMLLSGVRQGFSDTCVPIDTKLPRAAVSGIVCRPSSKIVDRVTLYLFPSQKDLLDAYATWLAAHKITARTNGGRCLTDRASEGGYLPGDDHGIVVPERGGCYLDVNGMAHYGVTMPPFVFAEVDGKVRDIAAVEAWAWRGNQDVPGGPTIWRSTDP